MIEFHGFADAAADPDAAADADDEEDAAAPAASCRAFSSQNSCMGAAKM